MTFKEPRSLAMRNDPGTRRPMTTRRSLEDGEGSLLVVPAQAVDDHAHPIGGVDQGDEAHERADLVVVVVLPHRGPGLVGHAATVADARPLFRQRQRGALGFGEYRGVPPGGDQVNPDLRLTRGRGLLRVDVDAETAAVDLARA
jgi:hypothetical protein